MRRVFALLLCAAVCAALALRREAAVPAQGPAEMTQVYAALTFDDGPHRSTTDRLLDGLRERGARATFFLVGEEIGANRDLVRRMEDEGHQVGNHTWGHRRLNDLTADEAAQEIGKTDALLTEILGPGSYWLRPPYGFLPKDGERLISMPMIKWSVDPRDWESRDKDKVVQAVEEAIQPNSIVLLHDLYPSSVDAALELVDRLSAKGYRFVTVEELLRQNGVTPQAGTLYRSGNG